MEREERNRSQTVVSIKQSLSHSKGASATVCPGSRETDHRPFRGPAAKRPGPLAADNGRNSWGPSWGLGRVRASSLLTSPPPPTLRPSSPLLSQGSSLESRPGCCLRSHAQLSSAQLATAEAVPRVASAAPKAAAPLSILQSRQRSLVCLLHAPPPSMQLHTSCPTPSLCTNNRENNNSNNNPSSCSTSRGFYRWIDSALAG